MGPTPDEVQRLQSILDMVRLGAERYPAAVEDRFAEGVERCVTARPGADLATLEFVMGEWISGRRPPVDLAVACAARLRLVGLSGSIADWKRQLEKSDPKAFLGMEPAVAAVLHRAGLGAVVKRERVRRLSVALECLEAAAGGRRRASAGRDPSVAAGAPAPAPLDLEAGYRRAVSG